VPSSNLHRLWNLLLQAAGRKENYGYVLFIRRSGSTPAAQIEAYLGV
jgi:hypothetical protein